VDPVVTGLAALAALSLFYRLTQLYDLSRPHYFLESFWLLASGFWLLASEF
jgi:hypothetical protein